MDDATLDSSLVMGSPRWSRAYIRLHRHPTRTFDQLKRFYRWAHLLLPKSWLRRYLTQGALLRRR